MSKFSYLTIAPISKDQKEDSYIDYKDQEERVANGYNWCWDDCKHNTSEVGNYFAFFFYGKKIIVHKILSIKPPSERLPTWSKRERNMLVLSDKLLEISWTIWQQLNGCESRMGTYRNKERLENSRPLLHSYLKSALEPRPLILIEEEEEEDIVEEVVEENNVNLQEEDSSPEKIEESIDNTKEIQLNAKLEQIQKLIKQLQNIELNYIVQLQQMKNK